MAGGDHHHHHVEFPKVPDASVYKIEDSEDLMKLQKRLAEKGLKDPWIRNHVWRYEPIKTDKFHRWVYLKMFTYGWKFWVPLLGFTFFIEKYLGIDYGGHGHGHGHGKNENNEHGDH